MKIVGINSHPSGSTKNIMVNILLNAQKHGHEIFGFYGNWKCEKKSAFPNIKKFGFYFENYLSGILSYLTGLSNVFSIFGTIQLVRKLKKIKPDIVHLHNLHLWTINIPILFKYLKKSGVKVVWTLHDCWSFTGKCPHFIISNCYSWKSGCKKCRYNKSEYPRSLIRNSRVMYNLKQKWFSSVPITFVAPTVWLSNLVKESFLGTNAVHVIYHGINRDVFKPLNKQTNFKRNFNDKKILLGVAYEWGFKKGLDVLIELSKKLNDEYVIVLVGTDERIDKMLPSNIVSIHKTHNVDELVDLYNSSELLLNPTREEVFGMVNLESIACGTPVIAFDTGGCCEAIGNCGILLKEKNAQSMKEAIDKFLSNPILYKEKCCEWAKNFDFDKKMNEYLDLYNKI